MMREIKFRGKRIDNGEWAYGSLYVAENALDKTKDDCYILPRCVLWRTTSEGTNMRSVYNAYKVDPETVGQYTGLKDKNSIDVYGNDIVMVGYASLNGLVFYSDLKAAWCVRFQNGNIDCLCNFNLTNGHYLLESFGSYHDSEAFKDDNPELLNES